MRVQSLNIFSIAFWNLLLAELLSFFFWQQSKERNTKILLNPVTMVTESKYSFEGVNIILVENILKRNSQFLCFGKSI